MRIPYMKNPPTFQNDEDNEILNRVQARRGEQGLLPLDLALLHAPKVANGWNTLLASIRTTSSLDPSIRELAILRPALLTECWFEWRIHLDLFQSTPSYTSTKLAVVADPNPVSQGALTDAEWAVLRYADAMTKDVKVEQEIFDALKLRAGFNEREIVEVTVTVASE